MKRVIKIFVGLILSVMVVLVIAALIFLIYLNPFSADGPFTGEPRENCNQLENPAQVFLINSDNKIEIYERTGDDPAPTVLLRKNDKNIKWCVYADAHSEVYSIEFHRYGSWWIFGTKVEGIVNWTYGHEWTGWYLSPFGGLRKYYYDW